MNLAQNPAVLTFAAAQAIAVIGWLIGLGNRISRVEASAKAEAQTTREILREIRALRDEVQRGAVAYAALKATVDALMHELRDGR